MNKIKFTSGTLKKISDKYYNLVLLNKGKQVYTATIGSSDAAEIINKHYPKISIHEKETPNII